ncbi:S24/S26 family peptidase [Carboxylicivirga sp. M1479]|uniref:S24/S26 family peptidase n=1 Tax=Carboxylicivirga sp. M1479 TaxID=2594476 RepID=UPI00117734FF|nr:S24/S26 family peptidase [Carboxylicivirga sp. M1479]TRX63008.1 hypothetical protein FNN09_19185 [Carboxylicivirga sp. M1479]
MANDQIQETLIQLLREGQTVEVPAHGMSMFPLLLPGDRLLISPVKPQIGQIGVFIGMNKLIAHRLIKIDNKTYFFKGDGVFHSDEPVHSDLVLGVVTQRKRGERISSCNNRKFKIFQYTMPKLTSILGSWFYYLGRLHLKYQKASR